MSFSKWGLKLGPVGIAKNILMYYTGLHPRSQRLTVTGGQICLVSCFALCILVSLFLLLAMKFKANDFTFVLSLSDMDNAAPSLECYCRLKLGSM